MIGVNIAGALARLAIIAVYLGTAVITGGASLATCAVVSGQAVATDLIAFLVHLAAGGKVIGGDRQRACTNQTVRRCAYSGITVVALLAVLAMVADSTIFAVLRRESKELTDLKKKLMKFYSGEIFPIHLTDSGVYITRSCMTVTLTGRAVSSVWSRFNPVISRSAFLA